MFIISCKVLNEPKLCGFDTQLKATEFVQTAKGDTVIGKIFKVDGEGHVVFYEVSFDGQVSLKPKEVQ
ncbi:hypothetical protein [Metabacillus sp. cB07]|uniref:hypothetical protein n=1 Tax=Metabacillus sp. cB07 TaxID=2806989 RepID=UPI0019396E8A|nr:hypothetical protein [Metabacillus sp. cB07]